MAAAVAAVIWIAASLVLLRVLLAAVLLLIAICCVWLISVVWGGESAAPDALGGSARRQRLLQRAHRVVRLRLEPASAEDDRAQTGHPYAQIVHKDEELARRERDLLEREAALVALRSSIDEVVVDLLGRQERLTAEAEQLQRELAGQIGAMQAVVDRISGLKHGVSFNARVDEPPICELDPRPTRRATYRDPGASLDTDADMHGTLPRPVDPEPTALNQNAEFDRETALIELECDLRLEKVEEREQMLHQREQQLQRRERELAQFVAEAQSQLNMREPARIEQRLHASLQ